MKKVVSVRIEEDIVDNLNYMCGALNISQAELLINAINFYIDCAVNERAGGVLLKIPNPNFNSLTEEQKKELVDNLEVCSKTSREICSFTDLGLYKLLAFADERLLKDSLEKTEKFKETYKKHLSVLIGQNFEESKVE